MFGSAILEVGIGLALVYLLLSLFCSVLSEWIAWFFNMRAKNLEKGIRSLFNDGKLPNQTDIADALYKHGLIQSLYRKGTKPSYIPAEIFSKTLWDVLAPADSSGSKTLADLRVAIDRLPSKEAREALQAVVSQTATDIESAREAIEDWFNQGMERVSGWYKRRTQVILIILALIVAAVTNTDSVVVAEALWKSPTLRASTVAVAEGVVKNPPAGVNGEQTKQENPAAQMEASLSTVNALKLPIGWPPSDKTTPDDPRKWPTSYWMILSRLLGWFMTAVALSLGAPFWFDGLNTFMNVRSTVKPKDADTSKGSQKS